MSTLPQRIDNRCLNCDAIIYGRYCQVCGQENVEHKLGIFGLIKHFIFDLLHFDGKFFSTLKMLFTKPGIVPLQYIQGKRKSYLEPFKMFFFTSTIVVLLLSIFSKDSGIVKFNINDTTSDSTLGFSYNKNKHNLTNKQWLTYSSAKAYKTEFEKKSGTKMEFFEYLLLKKQFPFFQKHTNNKAVTRDLLSDYKNKIPKLFLLTLPFFILLLALLFKQRKDLYYNEHGIYALYLYTFIYISILLIGILGNLIVGLMPQFIKTPLFLLLILGVNYYIFKSLKVFYNQSNLATIFKFIILAIGSILILCLLFILYSIIFIFI
jgi:hypothetical protein